MPKRNTNERLYQRGRVWWTWYYDNKGERHDESTKCRDRGAAVVRAQEVERRAADPTSAAQAEATVGDACELYIRNKRKLISREKRSTESREFFETKIGNVERIMQRDGSVRLVDLRPADLDTYVELREQDPGARTGSKVSAHTIKKELVAFRQALELAKRAGLFAGEIDPLFPTDHTAEYEPRERALDRNEVALFVRALMPDSTDVYRKSLTDGDRAARVAFLVATGARWSGSERATRADIGPDLSWVRLHETKTKNASRTVPIVTPEQKALLQFALENAGGTDPVLFRPWESVNRDFVSACKRAGIPRCSPNDLRRTMALWLRASGVPAEVVGMVLGHTTARMVETVYARLARHPADLRSLIERHLTVDAKCSAIAANPVDSATQAVPSGLALVSQVLNLHATGLNR